MAKAETTAARSPRGAKPVSQAFFTALETIPEASRAAVTKAAFAMIRDQMKMQREKAKVTAAKEKAAAAKEKARKPAADKSIAVAAKSTPKAKTASEAKPASKASPAKRRSRKPAEVPAAA